MERSFSPLIVSFLVFTPGRSASPGCAARKATARGRASVAIYVAEKFSSTPDLGGSPGSEKRSGSFKGPRERGRARVAQAAARTLASAPPPPRARMRTESGLLVVAATAAAPEPSSGTSARPALPARPSPPGLRSLRSNAPRPRPGPPDSFQLDPGCRFPPPP